jgi:uncharacterized protein involved in exopolysaccharide biosynthesis
MSTVDLGVTLARMMRATVFTMFCLSPQSAVLAQDARPSPCDAIRQLDAQVTQSREQISELLVRYSERHPFVIDARKDLERLETALAAQVALAKSQGMVCPASQSQTETASPPR